jgi:hypothetical protein
MAVGIYGTVRPADVNVNDIDVFYTFAPDRETEATNVQRIASSDILSVLELPEDEQVSGEENLLEGFYNMRLPANIFNQLGFYTIYLRPSVFQTTIIDCSVLSSLPSVKGIVLDVNDLPQNLIANNALQGYKIEYINDDGTKLRNTVRYVVTANRVVPVSQNVGNTSQRTIRYRFDDNGTLMFLQLTPSSSSDVKPNAKPFIGNPGETILISNTFFSPMAIEINLVENTIDTIVDIVGGEQIKDVDNGILTYYDADRNIIRQFNLFEIKEDVGEVSLFEVKERRTNIDESQNFDDIVDEVQ